jgi:iron complex transport system ATP-binding protein
MRLEARGLAYGHRGQALGRELDLTLAPGNALCVLGPNGAGKSTLLRTLLGLLPPVAGTVTLDGEDAARLDRAEISRRVAYVPQAAPAVFEFSVLDIVEMGRVAHRGAFARPARRDAEIARAALERLGIGALAERPIGAISGGERQLALIARALAAQSGCIVLDEPTAQLDYGNQARVMEELARLRDGGIGILLCTHDPDHAFLLADQVLLLRRGGALASGAAAQVLDAGNLSQLYGIAVVVAEIEAAGGRRRVSVPAAAHRAREAGACP